MNDHELDILLGKASNPKPSRNLAANFFEQSTNVIVFPQRKKAASWLVGIPLAASLAFGLWLGTETNIAASTTSSVAMVDDANVTSVDDLMSLIESDV